MATRGINKVILLGNLGQEPEVKTFSNGDCFASFSIATSESWRDKNTGQMRDKSEWHRIAVFGKSAEFAANYLHKGSQVYVEGQLQTRKWQDNSGQDRYSTEVVVRWPVGSIQLIGQARNSLNEGKVDPISSAIKEAPESYPALETVMRAPSEPTNWADFDDDIPF